MQFLSAVLCGFTLLLLSLKCVHTLQQVSYYPSRGYLLIFASPYFAVLCCAQVAVFPLAFVDWQYMFAVNSAIFLFAALPFALKKYKSPIKYTPRIIRLLILNFVLLAVGTYFIPSFLFPVFLPVITFLAFFICLPFEKLNNSRYVKKAEKKLKSLKCVKIGVTGSYAKTSVKNILAALLPNSKATPESCNTPLGIAKFVNGGGLDSYDYLIFEMGARKKGDIKQLCRLVKPDCGILTGIAPQHLDTFKTMDALQNEKCELIRAIGEKGFCILNGRDDIASSFIREGVCKKVLSAVERAVPKDLTVSVDGCSFALKDGDGEVKIVTPILSVTVSDNLCMAAAACLELGFALSDIESGARKLKQIPHRMEIKRSQNIFIIDDGYNANIEGVKACVKTLELLAGDKFAVAQGIVEGGEENAELNRQTGRLLGKVCKLTAVTGANSKYLLEGLAECGADYVKAESLTQAVELLKPHFTKDCFVLFQNDLPDNFN